MDNNTTETDNQEQEVYTIGCVHCGKTLFRFSESAMGDGEIYLACPECGGVTYYNGETLGFVR